MPGLCWKAGWRRAITFAITRRGPLSSSSTVGCRQLLRPWAACLPLGYVYTLFYLRYPPARFQREAQVAIDTVEGAYQVKRFGRFVFHDRYLTPGKAYGYLAYKDELKAADQSRRNVLFSDEMWEVGTMQPPANNPKAK